MPIVYRYKAKYLSIFFQLSSTFWENFCSSWVIATFHSGHAPILCYYCNYLKKLPRERKVQKKPTSFSIWILALLNTNFYRKRYLILSGSYDFFVDAPDVVSGSKPISVKRKVCVRVTIIQPKQQISSFTTHCTVFILSVTSRQIVYLRFLTIARISLVCFQ